MEIIKEENKDLLDYIEYLQRIILNRSIPESNKIFVKNQLENAIRLLSVTTTQRVLLTKEEYMNMLPFKD